uniref:Uncharacterized protein n=1 Tax=Ciona savignyi TaxID=51511 RepID=H2Y4X0_CIOSA
PGHYTLSLLLNRSQGLVSKQPSFYYVIVTCIVLQTQKKVGCYFNCKTVMTHQVIWNVYYVVMNIMCHYCLIKSTI